MARAGIDKNLVIIGAAKLANEEGLENITLKRLADNLGIQTPSLYNHISGLEDLRKQLMIYGWKQMEEKIIQAVIGISGYDALKAMGYAFYDYATGNPGVFGAMLWYNKFRDEETMAATEGLFSVIYKITKSLNISPENSEHLIRTWRGFLEGFSLLVNNGAFGHPFSIKDSFEISLNVLVEGSRLLEEHS